MLASGGAPGTAGIMCAFRSAPAAPPGPATISDAKQETRGSPAWIRDSGGLDEEQTCRDSRRRHGDNAFLPCACGYMPNTEARASVQRIYVRAMRDFTNEPEKCDSIHSG